MAFAICSFFSYLWERQRTAMRSIAKVLRVLSPICTFLAQNRRSNRVRRANKEDRHIRVGLFVSRETWAVCIIKTSLVQNVLLCYTVVEVIAVNKLFFKRCFAWFVDWLLSCLPCLLYILLCSPSLDRPTVTDLLGLFVFVPATCILFVLRDVIWKGRSLGKRIFRLYIIGLPSMTPATNEKKMMRNLLFFLFPIIDDASNHR